MVASVVQCSAVVTGAVAAGPVTAPPPVTHRPFSDRGRRLTLQEPLLAVTCRLLLHCSSASDLGSTLMFSAARLSQGAGAGGGRARWRR